MNKNLQNHNSGYKELKERYSSGSAKKPIQDIRGDILKKARESKGLSLESIHESTKVPLDVLKGIEEGYKIGNVSSYYIKGFVKIYAKYLGVDIHSVLVEHSGQKEETPTVVVKKENVYGDVRLKSRFESFWTKQNKKRVIIVVAVLVAVGILGKVLAFSRQDRVRKKEQIVTKKKVEEKTQVKDTKKESKNITEKKVVNVKNDSKDKAVTTTSKAVDISSTEVAGTESVVSLKDKVVVVVRAKSAGWLRVKSDGETVFQGELKIGDVETWTAKEKIEISGRHIGQLEFEINGKLIGSLGREDRQAKTVIITKNGLSVTK